MATAEDPQADGHVHHMMNGATSCSGEPWTGGTCLCVGKHETVRVKMRMGPGPVKEGGVGRIIAYNAENDSFTVKYVLGGMEKNIERKYIICNVEGGTKRHCHKAPEDSNALFLKVAKTKRASQPKKPRTAGGPTEAAKAAKKRPQIAKEGKPARPQAPAAVVAAAVSKVAKGLNAPRQKPLGQATGIIVPAIPAATAAATSNAGKENVEALAAACKPAKPAAADAATVVPRPVKKSVTQVPMQLAPTAALAKPLKKRLVVTPPPQEQPRAAVIKPEPEPELVPETAVKAPALPALDHVRLDQFRLVLKGRLITASTGGGDGAVPVSALIDLEPQDGGAPFTLAERDAFLAILNRDNAVFVDDGCCYEV
ncbi:unnamed protein product [Phaeothamnion confervicola]